MATFYFNGAVDGDWQNLGNWWMDDQFSVPATALPTSNDDVIALANISSNSGSNPTVVNALFFADNQITLTVTGLCTFDFSGNNGTINGDCTFNGQANNSGTITGLCTFNDVSRNYGTITGDCTFNTNYEEWGYYPIGSWNEGTITGDCTFNGKSRNGYDYDTVATINNGDCVFNDDSYNNGTINGNATFTNSTYATDVGGNGITGTVTFTSETPVSFTLSGINDLNYWTSDTTNWVFDTPGQNWTFTAQANNNSFGVIYGDCTFDDTDDSFGYSSNDGTVYGTCVFEGRSYNAGTINGDCTFNGTSSNYDGYIEEGDCTFNGTSSNRGTINGDCTFNDSSYNDYDGYIEEGDCTFNDSSSNRGTINYGDCTFNNSSFNNGTITGTITDNCTFNDSATNYVVVYGAWSVGAVNGNCTFSLSSAALHIDQALAQIKNSDSITGNIDFKYEKGINGSSILGIV